jgi:DNA-binding transcriptional LysR family regulator
METNRLKAFCTVVETKNLRKAADLLGISHSGLSKSMQVLQTELGLTLFQVSGRGIAITDSGLELYERSQSFLKELSRLLEPAAATRAPLLRIGSFEVFTSYLISHLMSGLFESPHTELEVYDLLPGRLEEALLMRRVDIGITYDPIPQQGIAFSKITSVRMAAYACNPVFFKAKFENIPFAVPAHPLDGLPSGVKGLDAWPPLKTQRLIRYRVDLMETGLALVRKGLCAIFIPEFVARLHNTDIKNEKSLVKISIPKGAQSIYRNVYLVHRESMILDPLTKQLVRAIRQSCKSEGSDASAVGSS